jgi:hypothetical protein
VGPFSGSWIACKSGMHDIQIAIQDPRYAGELLRLLAADGNHRVHLVDQPVSEIDGVVVVDEAIAQRSTLLKETNLARYVVVAKQHASDVDWLWQIGIRRVIPADYPPPIARVAVLLAELALQEARAGTNGNTRG